MARPYRHDLRCFRHQLLLGCQTHSPTKEPDQQSRFEEREYPFDATKAASMRRSLLTLAPAWSKFQCPMGPHEIVVAAKQLQVIFESFLPARLTDSFGGQGTPNLVGL